MGSIRNVSFHFGRGLQASFARREREREREKERGNSREGLFPPCEVPIFWSRIAFSRRHGSPSTSNRFEKRSLLIAITTATMRKLEDHFPKEKNNPRCCSAFSSLKDHFFSFFFLNFSLLFFFWILKTINRDACICIKRVIISYIFHLRVDLAR